ncbi:MAG: hypothetical protein J6X49_03505 [Victivallales bacterium]|nr:hypothetical protein [Victivallales bacterium]
MFIYKKFDSSKRLDDDQYKSLKIYGMADIRNGQDTPFVECANKAQAEEAKRQGRSIVGITAVPFIAPFTSLGTEIHETHKRVNVSGAVWLRINPNAAFREYILSHDGDGLTTGQITVEFARGLELNLEPYLNHVVNTENVEQIQKHGVEAADISALPGQLPNWCEVVKVMLAVDGTATASRYTQTVAEALRRQEIEEKKKHEGLLEVFIEQVWPFWKKNVIDVLKHPFDNMVKFKRLCCTTLLLLLFGAWALRMIVFMLGGGSPFARKSEINFKSEKTASCNIQKFLLETYMADKFSKSSTSKGKPFGGFKFGETYHFAEEDAQTVRGWVDSYVNARHGTLRHVKNEYNHPHGIPKILGWSRPTYQCTVGMEGRLEPDPYHLVVENDYDGSVKRCLDDMLLAKGKTKKGVTEYKSLKLRDGDVDILKQALHDDKALAGKGVVVRHDAEHEIVISVKDYTLNYQLDLTELAYDELLDVVKIAFKDELSRDVYFKKGKVAEPEHLTNSQVEKLQKAFVAGKRVNVTCIEDKDGKNGRLIFKMSPEEIEKRGLEEKDKQQKLNWWNNEEKKLHDGIMAKADGLKKEIKAIEIPKKVADTEYEKFKKQLQTLWQRQQTAMKDLEQLQKEITGYRSGLDGKIQKLADDHQKELEKLQKETVVDLKNKIDDLAGKLEIAHRHNTADMYTTKAEMDLKEVQKAFRQEIPDSIPAGQAKSWYDNQQQTARRWENKCFEAIKGIENYRNTELKEKFLLENKKEVAMNVNPYRERLNAVLEGWSTICGKALNCKQECQSRQITDKAKQLEEDLARIQARVREDDADDKYAELLDQLQILGGKMEVAVEELTKFQNEVKPDQYRSQINLQRLATAHQKQLEKQAAAYKTMLTQLGTLTKQINEARWQAKAHKVVEIRRGAAAKYVEEAEEALKATQADFRKEIPSAVQTGQTKEWYKQQEGIASKWETTCSESSRSVKEYLNTKLTDAFILENRQVTMDVRTYRTRLNAVLDGWVSMQRRALNCKQECQYKQVEVVFLQNQTNFWEKVEALNDLEREIKECQVKLQAKRQEIDGLTREEIKARRTEIKDRIYQEIVLRSKELERKARGFIAYFNGLIPEDNNDSWHYEEMLGPRVLRRKDVESLNAEMKDKIKALLEAQENRLLNLKKGNRRSCLKGLKDQAENLEGAAGNLRVLDDDDILKVRNVWPLNN